jgi:lysophospholipase II
MVAAEQRPPNACVLWLHGDAETGKAWERLEADPTYGLGVRLPWVQWAFPTAPEGAWFDYELPIIDATTEFQRVDEAVRAVHGMLKQIEAEGVRADRILLGGFGPGAALALLAGRTYPKRLAGIAGLSGWYMRPRLPSSHLGCETPVLLCHGEEDDEVPCELHTEACARLRRDGTELISHCYAHLGHRSCAIEQTVLAAPKNFITDRLRTLTPAAPVPRGARSDKASGKRQAPRSKLDEEWCKLDEDDQAAIRAMAEAALGADEGDGSDPSHALAAQLVDACEAGQRNATACTLLNLQAKCCK